MRLNEEAHDNRMAQAQFGLAHPDFGRIYLGVVNWP
jgi:hypothetical protein